MDTKTYDWLLIYFVHEIPMDMKYSNDLLNEVQQTNNGENNLVVMIRDSYEFINPDYFFTLNVCILQDNRFIPVNDPVLNGNDKRSWEVAFRYVFSHFPSKRKAIITYSHGAGFGINRETDVIRRSPNSPKLGCEVLEGRLKTTTFTDQVYFLDAIDKDYLLKHMKFRDSTLQHQIQHCYIKKDENEPVCTNLELLYTADLAKMLHDNLGDKKLDLLLMVNCYMQLTDTCYLLRDRVDMLVASEGSFSATGYDYKALSDVLKKSPSISNAALSVSILQAFEAIKLGRGEQDYFDRITLYANRLAPIEKLLVIFAEFVQYLLAQFHTVFPMLKFVREEKVREVTYDLVGGASSALQCIDLNWWLFSVCNVLPEHPSLKKLHEQYYQVLATIVLPESHVGKIILEEDEANNKKFGFSGLSIFYPKDTSSLMKEEVSYCLYFGQKLFSKTEPTAIWKTFLHCYLQAL